MMDSQAPPSSRSHPLFLGQKPILRLKLRWAAVGGGLLLADTLGNGLCWAGPQKLLRPIFGTNPSGSCWAPGASRGLHGLPLRTKKQCDN